ncbi:SMI1/KNR4 family protein [Dyadobacter jiangsuensis]|uniref:SMI1/KNR4 family protein SUKH-1 n=1 Tax=Dyadobacter jiangsuensis TaxID=1591085 RepID=A0A2P8F7F3_9BACT|nr:SMI1/KNR4 family protein [Dyadobacter jiangsuensis]PSL17649.1 SMI1/KNR4 family protein SUKH-1 [Dyadobacter jiangsuensis]
MELEKKWRNENVNRTLPANKADLELFQEKYNIALPDDLANYLQSLNGTGGDCTDDLFEFYSIKKIKKIKEEFKDWVGIPNYQKLLSIKEINDLYVFANMNFNLFAYAIKLTKSLEEANEVYILCGDKYKKIADSFSEFINLYLDSSIELQFIDTV